MSDKMTLPLDEAIKEMLAGRVMVDGGNWPHRFGSGCTYGAFEIFGVGNRWSGIGTLCLSGWRHATPEELAEIERCSR